MTVKEAADALGITKAGVRYHLKRLHPDGNIPKEADGSTIVTKEDFAQLQSIREVTAKQGTNKPSEAFDSIQEELDQEKQKALVSEEKAVKLTADLIAVRAELGALTADMEVLAGKCEEQQRIIDKLTEQNDALTVKNNELNETVMRLIQESSEANRAVRELSAAQARLTSQAQQIASMSLQRQGFGARLKALFAPKTVIVDDGEEQ